MGRMLEPQELLEETVAALQPKILAGKSVLITAGPTFELAESLQGMLQLPEDLYLDALEVWLRTALEADIGPGDCCRAFLFCRGRKKRCTPSVCKGDELFRYHYL